jgi:hypothetical protein
VHKHLIHSHFCLTEQAALKTPIVHNSVEQIHLYCQSTIPPLPWLMVQESTIDLNRINFRKKHAARPKNEKRRGREGVASPCWLLAISGRSTCQMFSGARNWKIIFYHACLLESQWSISDDDDWCNALGKNNSADGLLQSGVRNHRTIQRAAQAPKNNTLSVARSAATPTTHNASVQKPCAY